MFLRSRPFYALVGSLLVAAVLLLGVLGVVLPPPTPPKVPATVALSPPLTRHLLFVVVDGLRYDVATDPARMPRFSRAMREETSGELMAGRVSMTTSAILSFGTGQRGSFEQIVRNVNPGSTPFDSWLEQAHRGGLHVMSVGDPAWVEMYGSFLDEHRVDPEGVAIDVDFNPQTFASARELLTKNPEVLVAHFVTPDHQGHAYTIPSARYAAHIRGYDRDLFALIDGLPKDWSVVVAGDHGAADSGTHGADVPIQRRTVVFARGPGIVRGVHSADPIDQADLAGTCAALLGLPAPLHSRGHVLASWLDLPDATRVQLACADATRAVELARGLGLTEAVARLEPESRSCASLASAREVVTGVDSAIASRSGLASPMVPAIVGFIALIGVLTALAVLGVGAARGVAIALGVGALGVFLTWGVERLPGSTPNTARAVLFVLGNLPGLIALLVPGRVATLVERFPAVAPAILPGLLIATYTTNAQPEAFVAMVVSALLFLFVGGLEPRAPTFRAAKLVLPLVWVGLVLLGSVLMFSAGTRESDLYAVWLRHAPKLTLAVAIGMLLLALVTLTLRSTGRRRFVVLALGLALVVGACALRRFVPPIPGRIAIVVSVLVALVAALRRRRLVALTAGLFAYAWVSRDAEIIAVVITLLVADGVGEALARHRQRHGLGAEPLSLAQSLLAAAFVFGVIFVQRIGIQGALDFGAMDWGVAGFGDPHVPAWLVGGALGLKYSLAFFLVLGAFASVLGPAAAPDVLRAAFLAFLGRGVVLSAMFLVCGDSFWTGLRVLGDLPFALLWSVTAALGWLAQRYSALAWS